MGKFFAGINRDQNWLFRFLYFAFLGLYTIFVIALIGGFVVIKAYEINLATFVGLILMIGIGFGAYKINLKKFWIWLVILAVLLRAVMVFVTKVPVESDFLVQFSAAQFFQKNDFSFANWSYFERWGYQAGLVVYEGLLLKIINSVVFVKIMATIVSGLNVLLVYLISKQIFKNQRVAQVIGVLAAFSIYQISMGMLLSNTTQAQFFLLLSLWIFLKYDRTNWKVAGLIGFLLVVAKVFRPDSLVFLVAYVVYYGFLLFGKNKVKRINSLKSLASILVVYVALFAGISWIFSETKITKIGLSNQNPEWGFVLGTNYESSGRYVDIYSDLTKTAETTKTPLRQIERNLIKQNVAGIIKSPAKSLNFYAKKESIYWFNGLSNYYGVFYGHLKKEYPNRLKNNDYLKILSGIDLGTKSIINILGMIALIPFLIIWQKRNDESMFDQNVIFFLIFAFIVVALLMEVQYKYSTHAQFLTLIASGYFLEFFTNNKKNQTDV